METDGSGEAMQEGKVSRKETEQPTRYLALVFKRSVSSTVARLLPRTCALLPTYDHVEMSLVSYPDEGYLDTAREIFTSYVGCLFAHYRVDVTQRDAGNFAVVAVPVTQLEYERAVLFLARMCAADVHYNFVDLIAIPISRIITGPLSATFLHDVEDDEMPHKVFCSQAMVLVLRHALRSHRGDLLRERLHAVNSRTCTPGALFHLLQVAGCRVEATAERLYTQGHLEQ